MWFQFDVISPEVGCMAAGSVCNVGRLIFFLSERGFMMCDGGNGFRSPTRSSTAGSSRPIRERTFGHLVGDRPAQFSEVLWAMPGTPGRILNYNWVLKRWATIETDVTALFTGLTAVVSIDAVDAIYGNLDAVTVSLDDPSLAGGNPILMLLDASNVIGSLTGNNLVFVR
jgi:hypothetical protein